MTQIPTKPLTPLQQSFLLINKLEAKVVALESEQQKPIAIIGIGCRFPGGADNPEAFWQLLQEQRETVGPIPADRWDAAQYYDADPDKPGKMYVQNGSFLNRVDGFDPGFFGISPREAVSLDPQQRLLLEVVWETLEHAGIAASGLKGSRTGLFVGVGQHDYLQLQLNAHQAKGIDAYFGTGGGTCFASGRLSYCLGFNGPSISIDTACSSSLVAIHLACQSLRCGESDLALTGGVQLILSPEINVFLSRSKALAPDGRCKTFDAAADGFGRGEGCGMVALKRLSDAERDGDSILAVILGSSVNHDGATSGLTVPNGLAQQALIRNVMQHAGIDAKQVDYIEAHGTGTELGDPLEVEALAEVFKERSADKPLLIGSVKTNIGHLEAASGVAGLIKTVLALQQGEIPAHLNFKRPSPHIDWARIPLQVTAQRQAWPVTGNKPRIAGISAFGLSGTNAHVLVAEAPPAKVIQPEKTAGQRPVSVLALSAKSPSALLALTERYRHFIADNPDLDWADVCFSANTGRCHFKYRLALMAATISEAGEKLAAFTVPETGGVIQPKIAFLFTGQGSQTLEMGLELYRTQALFRNILDQCDAVLHSFGIELLDILYSSTDIDKLQQTGYAQPALFALEYALARLWMAWGTKPAAVIGHSLGEYVAACIAGVFGLEDGLKLVAERGRLMQALPANGKMLAVRADEARVNLALAPYAGAVVIAAYNAPRALVISGTSEAVDRLNEQFQQQGVATQYLPVSHAFHSPLMAPMLAEFKRCAETVTYALPQIPVLSNLDGLPANAAIASADYWLQHTLAPVRFSGTVETLCRQNYNTFIEIGAKPLLSGLLALAWPDSAKTYHALPSLRPGESDWQILLHGVAHLYQQGAAIDWAAFDKDYPRQRIVVPTYPFQRKRYWVEATAERPSKQVKQSVVIEAIDRGDTGELLALIKQQGALTDAQQAFLPELLTRLVNLHQAPLLDSHYYRQDWRLKPLGQTSAAGPVGFWLIFAGLGGLAEDLAKRLDEVGQPSVLVYAEEQFRTWRDGKGWSINPKQRTDFDRLLSQMPAPVSRVVYLWGTQTKPVAELDADALNMHLGLGCQAALTLLQALLKHFTDSPKVCLVTLNAVAAAAEDTLSGLAQAPLWGFAKSWALEYPDAWDAIIDLPVADTGQSAEILTEELLRRDNEEFVAYRNSLRYGARLVRYQPEAKQAESFSVKAEAAYLITGGLGALGLHAAQWLVEQGAKQLLLVGRSAPSEAANRIVEAMRQAGVDVKIESADVADFAAMSALFAAIAESDRLPLRGIIHAAGTVGFTKMDALSPEQLQAIIQPKVQGGWILHGLSLATKLDFFICFSSIASLWGA